jgi:hypothetical protein
MPRALNREPLLEAIRANSRSLHPKTLSELARDLNVNPSTITRAKRSIGAQRLPRRLRPTTTDPRTVDGRIAQLSYIALHAPNDTARLRALQALEALAVNRGDHYNLAPPLSDAEVIPRLATLMRGFSHDVIHAALAAAAKLEEPTSAAQAGQVQEGDLGEHLGVPPRQDLRTHEGEVQQGPS